MMSQIYKLSLLHLIQQMHRDVGEAISKITTPAKFSIVSTYCGHGQYFPSSVIIQFTRRDDVTHLFALNPL